MKKRKSPTRADSRSIRNSSKVEKITSYVTSFTPEVDSSIVKAILADHRDLKSLSKLLKDEKISATEKRKVYPYFASLLSSHSKSEEKALYSLSVKFKDLKAKTLEGEVEHLLTDYLMKKIELKPKHKNIDAWLAKVQVIAEILQHHLEEEESDLLPVIRHELKSKSQSIAAKKFLTLRKRTQKMINDKSSGALSIK